VEQIGEHVTAIESAVHNEDSPASTIIPFPSVNSQTVHALPPEEKAVPSIPFIDEKHVLSRDVAPVRTARAQFSLPRLTCGLMLRRLRRAFSRLTTFGLRSKTRRVKPSFTRAALDLHRMARTRRLATSVSRVLATKPEVVAGICKRLLASDGPASSDDAEVAIYFGDIQGKTKVNRSAWRMS
jgi:magnesium transporter